MGTALDTIIKVNISKQAQAVTQVGFGTPLILGLHTRFAERVRTYTSMDGVAADFQTSDAEYIHAQKVFSQELNVDQLMIGRRTAAVAQVITFTPTPVANATLYTVTINGTLHSYTSDADATASEIVAGLLALINAGAQASKVTASGTTTLIVTSDTAGTPFTYASTANMVAVVTTANNGVVEDIQAVQDENDDWYGLVLTSKVKAEILLAAGYIETQFKIFMAASEDSDIPTTATDDVMSQLQALAYDRTALIYKKTDAEEGPDAAWLGEEFPKVPGSSTYKFKELKSIVADSYTATQRGILIGVPGSPGKNANIYEKFAGKNITEEGFMASGLFIDIQIGVDWIHARIQEGIFQQLTDLDKIPFTDDGIGIVENEIRKVMEQGVKNGLIAPGEYTVTVPKASEVSFTDRANRVLPDVKFNCRFAGALHFVRVDGVVTV